MIPADVLAQLADIQPPPEAGWWPPAPGWWVLAALTLVLVAAAVFAGWRRYRRTAPRRAALKQLARYPMPASPDPDWYAGLNRLLKETALAYHPQDNPAGLSGQHWSRFLARTSANPDAPWEVLVQASYRPHSDLPPAEAHKLVAGWIRRQS